MTYLFLDPFPDNFGHFVTVDVDDGFGDGHFTERSERSVRDLAEHFI